MEVSLSPEQQAKLARLAQERGTDAHALAREAIERLLDYDDWFVREVEKVWLRSRTASRSRARKSAHV
jgi:predicted transcriptional regulator